MAIHGLWLWLVINLQQNPNSFLWVMERNPPVYFFGTIHVPYTKVWDYIPLNSKQAFKETDRVYFELDLTDSETLSTLAQCQMLPKGMKLRKVIPRTLYKRIRKHLSYVRKMMPMWMTADQRMMGLTPLQLYKALTKNWYKKRPIWIMLLLNALTEYDTKGRGVAVLDTYLIHEAVLRNKKTGSIESVEEQCQPLNALNNSQVVVALNQTLVLHEKVRRREAKLAYSTKDLIHHYNCGNLKDVLFTQDISNLANLDNSSISNNFAMEQTRKIDKYLRTELIYKRNRRMSKRVSQLIQDLPNESFLFAFGAGHFLGNDSIIDILQEKGFKISHVRPGTPLPRYGRKRDGKATKTRRTKCKPKRKRKTRKRSRSRKGRRRRKHKKQCSRESFVKKMSTPEVAEQVPRTTEQSARRLKAARSSSSPSCHYCGGYLLFTTVLALLTFRVIS